MNTYTKEDLRRFQDESLDDKIQRTLAKIAEWYTKNDNMCYVSFSGGKDSTVLADICAKWCSVTNQPLYLVFVDTGLEYPEIRKHVKMYAEWLEKTHGVEVVLEIIRPEMSFVDVIKKFGYPILSKSLSNTLYGAQKSIEKGEYSYRLQLLGVSESEAVEEGLHLPSEEMLEKYRQNTAGSKFFADKYKPILSLDFNVSHYCCDVMKKSPAHKYEKKTGRKPLVATMTDESMLRENKWLKHGCNSFTEKHPKSQPMSFWTEQDVLRYIVQYGIPIASVYGEVVNADEPNQLRIEDDLTSCRLCTTGCERTGCIYCGFGAHLEKKGEGRYERLKQTHPRQYEYCIGGGEYDENGKWIPNKQGLGLGHVFDELNKIYGDDFIPYK